MTFLLSWNWDCSEKSKNKEGVELTVLLKVKTHRFSTGKERIIGEFFLEKMFYQNQNELFPSLFMDR